MSYKFNPLTGQFDLVGSSQGGASPDNFSLIRVNSGSKKTIPSTQEMLLSSDLLIDGELVIDGSLVEIDDLQDNFSYERVASNKNVLIQTDQVMPFYTSTYEVDGVLIVDGHLLEIPQ